MDTNPVPPPSPETEPIEPSSLTDRLTDVIAAPGEVFEEVKATPVNTANWVVPLVISMIGLIIYVCVAFSQPNLLEQLKEQRVHGIQKKVAAGKFTQEQADQYEAGAEKFSTPEVMKIFGCIFGILGAAAGFFLLAWLIWLGMKWFAGANPAYMKVVEICGLALVIDIPQKIVRTALMAWKGNWLATASPALFLTNPDSNHWKDSFLAMFDLLDFWWLAVLTLGISKLGGISYGKAAAVTFGIWFGFRLLAVGYLYLMPPS